MKREKVLWRRVMILLLGTMVTGMLLCVLGSALTHRIRGYVYSLFLKDDPDYAAQVAHTMIDYALPPGYR